MLVLNISICCLILLLGFNLKHLFRDFSQKDKYFLNLLFLYHFAIGIIFHIYIYYNGGDAIYYWNNTKSSSFLDLIVAARQGSGTDAIQAINYLPAAILDLSIFTGNILYALFGYIGFLYLYRILKTLMSSDSKIYNEKLLGVSIFPWILFLPNLHFWSSGIGKDSLLFFAIALFSYSLLRINKRWMGIIVSVLISLIIRPHILLFLLFAFGIAYILDGKLKVYQKFFIFLIFVVGALSIFDYVIQFIQLESLESSAITEYATKKASVLNRVSTGSGVDISSYPYIIKVFTFLYRPFFFDVNGILALIASFDNLVFFLFCYKVIVNKPIRAFRRANFLMKGSMIYFIVGTLAFSMILGNLGIMLRQKNMFVPYMILFGLWVLYDKQLMYKNE